MLKGLIREEALEALGPEARDEVVKALRELERKSEQDRLSLYFPTPKQQIFHSFRTPVRLFSGGNQSGKTTAGLGDDLIQALDEEDLPSHLREYKCFHPPFLCRIMAPSFSVLNTVIYQKLQELLPPHTLASGNWGKAFDRLTQTLHFANGSKFFFMSYDQDVSKMGGASINRVHYDEEPPLAVRGECRVRVMAKEGDEIFTQTPVEGLTWSFDGLWIPATNEDYEVAPDVWIAEDTSVVRVDMDDNPTLTENAKRLTLAGYSAEERQARKEGRYVALHGLVYSDFRRSRHLIPETMPPKNTNVIVGIDPGIRNRAAVVWAYLTAEDQMVVFAEGYYEGYTVRQVCDEIKKGNEFYEVKPLFYVIDPAARNKQHQTGRSDQMEYADHGIVTIAGQHDLRPGINRVKERLETDRLSFTANCQNLIKEIERYRWKNPPKNAEDAPEKPVKRDDHLLDALRYVVMSRPYLPSIAEINNETELEKAVREDQERGDNKPQDHEFGGGVYA
jgi:phage terminase large subunit-like protein